MCECYSTYLSIDVFVQTVNDLPADVLTYIFEIVQQQHYQQPSQEEGAYAWTYISWVCQNWRWIALSSPGLWTTISIDTGRRSQCNLAWIAASLERAAGALLQVTVLLAPSGFKPWRTIHNILLPSVSTFRRFRCTYSLGACGLCNVEDLTSFISSMTSLEDLRLRDSSEGRRSRGTLYPLAIT